MSFFSFSRSGTSGLNFLVERRARRKWSSAGHRLLVDLGWEGSIGPYQGVHGADRHAVPAGDALMGGDVDHLPVMFLEETAAANFFAKPAEVASIRIQSLWSHGSPRIIQPLCTPGTEPDYSIEILRKKGAFSFFDLP
jgi:hypothetical protein